MNENGDLACVYNINSDTDITRHFATSILEALGFGVVIVDADNHKIVYANSKVLSMGGYSEEAIIGHICHKLLCPAEIGKCPITDLCQEVDNSERMMLLTNETKMPIIKTVVPINLRGKHYLIESIVDNTKRKQIQEQLTEANNSLRTEIINREKIREEIEYLAYHDHLTGLANRLLFIDQLNHAMSLSKRMAKMLAIMFLDLDGFKLINDSMGHAAGDQLLKEVSKRLINTMRKSDLVARVGGDEFIIMIENEEDIDTIKLVAEKILNCFRQPFRLKNNDCFITTSVGVAVYPTDGEDAEKLIKNADIAMYKAKEKGRNQYVLCTPVMKTNVIETMKFSNMLYCAIDRNELELHYQPQVSSITNKIIGLEALLRWNHPIYGMVPPGKFIPIAEHNGLIISIGEWVLRTACRQNKAWQDAGLINLRVAVNLSVRQFQNPDITNQVNNILRETGLDPQYLELEITESMLMKDMEYVIHTLNCFKDAGISISIDDFGTEYSSLSYLKTLPIDKIKIAMPFVQGINVSDKDEAITKAIIVLARSLGLNVIAEGVETETQFSFLSQSMCDEIQGYYFYKPMPAHALEELLRSSGKIKRDASL
ncbi:MAG: EAL domain-containing protein [Smithella sp.]